jgi:D-alanyl-D-alanine dipeptidase
LPDRLITARAGCVVAAVICLLACGHVRAQGGLPPGFVYLRDVDPTILQDIRYASFNNFVGHPLNGYAAPECVLRRDVAQALKQVQADLAASHYLLKVYDCYRPTSAVRAMAQWAHDGAQPGPTKRFFPRASKNALFALGYIASVSRHSSGTAIDLTVVEAPGTPAAPFDPSAQYGPCNGPAADRAPDNSLDMGTGYDCLDVMSYTHSAAVTAEQRARRAVLASAMARRGFANYFREWWHFAYSRAGPIGQYDFPIRPR